MEFSRNSRSLINGIIFFTIVIAGSFVLTWTFVDQPHSPEQPIPFSHALHAGRLSVGCAYCHRQARRSPVAGIPSIKTCLDCHRGLKDSAGEKGKLVALLESSPTIAWEKVYNLPDHVNFTHKRHVRAGIECQSCHGPVETMERVERVQKLTMGWCLSCHRKVQVHLTSKGERHMVDPNSNPHNEIVLISQGKDVLRPSIDCATCHK